MSHDKIAFFRATVALFRAALKIELLKKFIVRINGQKFEIVSIYETLVPSDVYICDVYTQPARPAASTVYNLHARFESTRTPTATHTRARHTATEQPSVDQHTGTDLTPALLRHTHGGRETPRVAALTFDISNRTALFQQHTFFKKKHHFLYLNLMI